MVWIRRRAHQAGKAIPSPSQGFIRSYLAVKTPRSDIGLPQLRANTACKANFWSMQDRSALVLLLYSLARVPRWLFTGPAFVHHVNQESNKPILGYLTRPLMNTAPWKPHSASCNWLRQGRNTRRLRQRLDDRLPLDCMLPRPRATTRLWNPEHRIERIEHQ